MRLPNPLPVLRGPRVTLRAAQDRDASALFAIHSHPEVLRYWTTTPWTNRAKATALIARDRAALAAGEAVRFMIADGDDQVIGCVSLHRLDAQSRRGEIGYLLGRWAWGQGYATEGLGLALDFAFGPLGLHRVEADTDPRNVGSTRVLERLGFVREGLLRERWIVAGEVSDTVYYGLLDREWLRRHPAP